MTGPEARFAVDPWDPGYAGVAEAGLGLPLEESAAPLNLDVEIPGAEWQPIAPTAERRAGCVQFVDGVRRIEARIWFQRDDDGSDPGIAASYAAGVVRCDGSATVGSVQVERGLFSASPAATDIHTPCGETFHAQMATSGEREVLSAAMQERMRSVEIAVAVAARHEQVAVEDDLLVVDGPLRGRENLPRTIGYVKTHQASYLPPTHQTIVGRLRAGERTPVFTLGSHWIRHTWYLRLPGPITHPWAGIVRCECSSALTPSAAIDVAEVSAATLPAFASSPHKDGRAPQNLYPIGGLERLLRHRLGDRGYLYRQLCRAASR